MRRWAIVVGLVCLGMAGIAGAASAESESSVYFFGIPADELQAAVAARHRLPRPKVADDEAIVELALEPAADVVMAYTSAGEFDFDWFIFHPGTVAVLHLPPGTYDLMVAWPMAGHHPPIVIREGLELGPGTHELDVSRSEAAHILKMPLVDSQGTPIPVQAATVLRALRIRGVDTPVYETWGWFLDPLAAGTTTAGEFSTLSSRYTFEHHIVVWDKDEPMLHPAYSYAAAFRGGIDHDVTLATDPGSWVDMTLRHHPGPGVASLIQEIAMFTNPFADLADDQVGVSLQRFCWGVDYHNLEAPFEQQLWVQPFNDPEATIGFFQLRLYEAPHCGELGDAFYKTPLIGWADGLEAFVRGSATPVYSPDGPVFDTGLGPYYWFARLAYAPDTITISPALGFELIPFLGQTGSIPGGPTAGQVLPYALYRGDTLVRSGELANQSGNRSIRVPIDEPGEHTLVLRTLDPYWLDDVKGMTVAALRMGVGLDDQDPPYLTHFAVTADGGRVAHLVNPGGTVEFAAFDEGTGIASATAWYTVLGVERPLEVHEWGQDHFSIEMSEHLFAGHATELTIHLEDQAGSLLEQSLLLPVVPGPAQPSGQPEVQ